MRLSDLIEQIDDWQTKTIDEVWEKLSSETRLFIDPDWWSLLGLAKIIGPEKVKPFTEYLDSVGFGWVAIQAAGKGVPIGDLEINTMLRMLGNPDGIKIADAGRRLVNALDLHGIKASKELAATVLSGMQLGVKKRIKKAAKANQYNLDIVAIDEWDGNPATEPF
jgi:hypothetical protein